MIRILFTFLILISVLSTEISSQNIVFDKTDFVTSGDAIPTSDRCFRLTEAILWSGGAVWYKEMIDLNDPFIMEMDVSFGCYDEDGADGIVFVFHPYLTTGFAGEGIGFGRLFPSLGVEMDTYQNYHLEDPSYDHVAIMTHGYPSHEYGLTRPKRLKEGVSNVEDCKTHRVKIDWDPSAQNLQFYFDGQLRINQSVDIVNDIFGGDSKVYWGFTSATGGKVNKHMICLERLVFTETVALSKRIRTLLLNGDPHTFKRMPFRSGSATLPSEAKEELDAFIDFLSDQPDHTIILEGFTDSSGSASANERISMKRAESVAKYLISKGIAPDRIQYFGQGEKNPIAPNDTEEGRLKNRRIELRLIKSRV
ncbi:MAG: OmpA family protein [Saprospiraceae bacterium]|nr:OmpA family protein [Saprospiraceae bacterium]